MSPTPARNRDPLTDLQARIAVRWCEVLTRPHTQTLLTSLASGDLRAYALYLIQVYHYASHTARNQALVGVNPATTDPRYMKFCFEHALEEVGHELMALHDLRAVGLPVVDPRRDLPGPLPATELTVAYLYWVAQHGDPIQRLGYSLWSETCYQHIGSAVTGAREGLGLERAQMTFFYSHAHIDEKHARDVEAALRSVCKTPADWAAVARTTEITLDLTDRMLEEIAAELARLEEGASSDYALVQTLRREGVTA